MNESEPKIGAGKVVGRITLAFLLLIGVFLVSNISSAAILSLPGFSSERMMQPFTHLAMLALSLILILILSKGRMNEYGFSLPKRFSHVLWPTIHGAILGALATVIMNNVPGKAPGSENYSFAETVLFIWILASIAEETLFRGLLQGFLRNLSSKGFTVFGLRLSLPVFVPAVLFSLVHLALLTTGTGFWKLFVILCFAFLLGIVAGLGTQSSKSLIPAMAAHMFFNIAGFVAGIVILIVT
jgi:membrane protease YdiL (CAAX protease family)